MRHCLTNLNRFAKIGKQTPDEKRPKIRGKYPKIREGHPEEKCATVSHKFESGKVALRRLMRVEGKEKDNPRYIGMLSRTAYPVLGPSIVPSRVIFLYSIRDNREKAIRCVSCLNASQTIYQYKRTKQVFTKSATKNL